MQAPSFADIQQELASADLSTLPPLEFVILRNIVVDPIVPYLRHGAKHLGFNAKVTMGEFDNISQEALGAVPGLLTSSTDVVLVAMRLEGVSWQLSRAFPGLSATAVADETQRVAQTVAVTLQGIRRQTSAVILWVGFELPVQGAMGFIDSQLPNGQRAAIQLLNQRIADQLNQTGGAYYLEINALIARLGTQQFFDQRYWHIGRAPYSRRALEVIAAETMKPVAALKGKAKKCLVLDCDNTLWGGIIGEDGMAGIKLGSHSPGSTFRELQQEALNLYHRGILLAICSKNNEQDVWEVFQDHPDMVIRREHIAAAEINWEDKATNLRRIAARLNIGLDSLVFIDDSEFEINLVRQNAPEVTAIHLAKDKMVEAREMLQSLGLFDNLTVSEEDRRRGEMYRADQQRKQHEELAPDLDSYLRSLEMVLRIQPANEVSVPRIAQLTQKTNQFNLTTRRYSEAEIASMATAPDCTALSASLADKFGDYGLIGVLIVRVAGEQASIDSMLLSCRALGRGVEEALLEQALDWARARGAHQIVGQYLPTAKNTQVQDFYPRMGFTKLEATTQEPGAAYHLDLAGTPRPGPTHFKSIDSGVLSGRQKESQ